MLPVKLVWRLLKATPVVGLLGALGVRTQQRDDGDAADWADPTDESVTAAGNADAPVTDAVDAASPTEADVSTVATDTPVKRRSSPRRFRRVLLGAGVLSGLSAFIAPFVYQVPLGLLIRDGLLTGVALDVGLPVAVTAVCARGLSRRRAWAWYGGMAWGALVVVTYLLRGVGAGPLLSPFSGAWLILYNLGAFVNVYDPLALLSAVGVGGVVLVTGSQARPGSWTEVPEESVGAADMGETTAADETPSATTSDSPATRSSATTDATDAGRSSAMADGTSAAADVDDASTNADEAAEPDEQTTSEQEETMPATDRFESDPVAAHREALTATDAATRLEAVQAITETAVKREGIAEETIRALAERLEHDNNPEVRVAACEALGQVGADADRIESLLKSHRLDPNGDVSRAASRALRNIE